MSNITIDPDLLPNSLRLPAHLSAHKYFFVCTLTVAAWDTLVLTPRSWKLLKSEGWPVLKAIFFFLRFLMPAEFTIVGVAFFDADWSRSACQRFFLFEPICTAVLLAACSVVHTIRIHGIYDKNRSVLYGMCALLALQVVITGICCAFYRSVPLLEGQGCIAGPKHGWVGVYWISATLLYSASFALAVNRSSKSLSVKVLSPWKLMLRDGLNLYAAIWVVNMVNVLFWFIVKPNSDHDEQGDSIRTIVTSMTAVTTTTMTLRIILSVRGSLFYGGSFAGVWPSTTGTTSGSRGIQVASARVPANAPSVLQITSNAHTAPTYTIDGIGQKTERGWDGTEGKNDILGIPQNDHKPLDSPDEDAEFPKAPGLNGVKITVDREIDNRF
ncbi:hypothetical protein BJV77DRAFT_1028094 [Russula vinacea]|nr:hypothetical protein BJV77DRAFT_1028094 [Russula vinacea]